MEEILEITLQLATVLEDLRVPYLVGGSLASSLHGLPRATLDADFLAFMEQAQVEAFVSRLKEDYYADEIMIRDAIEKKGSFNVIHLATMFKVDFFVSGKSPLLEEEIARRQKHIIDDERGMFVASPEDIVVQKLYWYRLGSHVSDRQWTDALGVVKVQKGRLDVEYMRRIAKELNVNDLLDRALGN